MADFLTYGLLSRIMVGQGSFGENDPDKNDLLHPPEGANTERCAEGYFDFVAVDARAGPWS